MTGEGGERVYAVLVRQVVQMVRQELVASLKHRDHEGRVQCHDGAHGSLDKTGWPAVINGGSLRIARASVHEPSHAAVPSCPFVLRLRHHKSGIRVYTEIQSRRS